MNIPRDTAVLRHGRVQTSINYVREVVSSSASTRSRSMCSRPGATIHEIMSQLFRRSITELNFSTSDKAPVDYRTPGVSFAQPIGN